MDNRSHRYNIALCLPKRIADIAIAASKTLSRKKSAFVLGTKDFYPHVTLYMTQLPDKNIPEAVRRIFRMVKKKKSIGLRTTGAPHITSGYVGINFKKTKRIGQWQKELVALLNPLREGRITKESRMQFLHADRTGRKNILRFGSQHVFAKFDPHLTLTKLKNEKNADYADIEIAASKLRGISFRSAAIGLFKAGEYGTCRSLVKVFRLKN